MRDFSIDIIWAKLQMAIAAVGGWLGYFLGGMDGLLTALLIFMAVDYVTGLMCAVQTRSCPPAWALRVSARRCSLSCWWVLPTSLIFMW